MAISRDRAPHAHSGSTPAASTQDASRLFAGLGALDNLLGNAWKFTEPREHAVIELGVERETDRHTYYVRDNGVGFDIRYVDTLFKAFHRLHTDSELSGTGRFGLATVQRIIRRHGGDVRAEEAVGAGATIWFTLGEGAARGDSPPVIGAAPLIRC